jgi:hypothetical protein
MLRIAMPKWLLSAFIILTVLVVAPHARAYQPVLETRPDIAIATPEDLYEFAMKTGDPTFASYAIFGELTAPSEVDMYVFIAAKDEVIPVELTVPAKTKYVTFRPTTVLIGPYLPAADTPPLPFAVPLGVDVLAIPSPDGSRERTCDLMSLSWYYRGIPKDLLVTSGEIYFLAVFDPSGETGEYRVHLGTTDNFSESVMSTVPVVDPANLIFEHSRPEDQQRALEDRSFRAQTAKQWFFVQKTPFETLDSRVKMVFDLFGFYVLRIPAWFR